MRRSAMLLALFLAATLGCNYLGSANTPAELSRLAGQRGWSPNSGRGVRFVVMSDRTGGHQPGAWAKAIEDVNRLRPDFVICVGDLIEGYTEDPGTLYEQWMEFDAITARLRAPFFYCAGNHDVTGKNPRKIYTSRHGVYGRTYYSFDYRDCHFIVLDSTAIVDDLSPLAEAQWAWLEKDLARAKNASHVFIFEHHPLFATVHWKRLRALLDPTRTTIFSGHQHRLSYDEEDGVPYFVLAATATKVAQPDRQAGRFLSYAYVAVEAGRPSVSILPVGEVLPRDFVSRALPKRLDALARAISLGCTTAAGGEVALNLSNPTDVPARCTFTWSGQPGWFQGGLPKPETLTLAPGASVRRGWRVLASKPGAAAPVLTVEYEITHEGKTATRTRKIPLPVAAVIRAGRVGGITIDGRLEDWAKVPGHRIAAKARVRDNPEAWTGPEDCSFLARIGYDEENLYLAVDVTDEALVTDAPETWYRDGVEIFWDPRPPAEQGRAFAGTCRQLMIPVPPAGEKPRVSVRPPDPALAAGLKTAVRRRKGGYVVELAIPLPAVGGGFRPGPGKTLRVEVLANDRDDPAGGAKTSCMVLSGDSDASRNTVAYAVVRFE